MVEKISANEYAMSKAYVRCVNSNSQGRGKTSVANGYRFYYTPVVNDVPLAFNNDYYAMLGMEQYIGQPLLMVEVDGSIVNFETLQYSFFCIMGD